MQESRIAQAFSMFRNAGIEPVLIKGRAAGRYYPDDVLRESIDIDLAVSRADFEKSRKLIRKPAFDGLAVDLHRELRHLDTVPWKQLFARSRLITGSAGSVRVLAPEDHLRVLCVHWLTDGGLNRDRLWDIFYAVDRRDKDFDWDKLLMPVDERRRRWIVCTIGLAHKYLGLDLARTPIEREAEELPDWLTAAIEQGWAAGRTEQALEIVLHDRRRLLRQLLLRFDQNPVWATIQMNGSFDARTRFFYKAGLFVYRIPDSVRRLATTIRGNWKPERK